MGKFLEELLLAWCAEYKFAMDIGRKWALDFYVEYGDHDKSGLGIEIDGGVFIQGRHTRGTGFIKDCEKLNECAIRGISILRFTPSQVLDGSAKETIRRWRDAR